mmetsp:Transcript_43623/g.132029  ORF Transcript_43623/g.132029 Transcript_43623/m.132029 type:complete len:247 (-) Transcript_43623:220-960(-)
MRRSAWCLAMNSRSRSSTWPSRITAVRSFLYWLLALSPLALLMFSIASLYRMLIMHPWIALSFSISSCRSFSPHSISSTGVDATMCFPNGSAALASSMKTLSPMTAPRSLTFLAHCDCWSSSLSRLPSLPKYLAVTHPSPSSSAAVPRIIRIIFGRGFSASTSVCPSPTFLLVLRSRKSLKFVVVRPAGPKMPSNSSSSSFENSFFDGVRKRRGAMPAKHPSVIPMTFADNDTSLADVIRSWAGVR